MTEDEAKSKWCPFIRFSAGNELYYPFSSRAGFISNSDGADAVVAETRCIGSACMAWRETAGTGPLIAVSVDGKVRQPVDAPAAEAHRRSGWSIEGSVASGFCGLAGASA